MNPAYAERVIADVADTSTVLPAMLAAIATGRFEEAGNFLTDEVVLEITGYEPFSGCWEGREAVVAAIRRNFTAVRDQQPVVEATVHSGYTTALLIREKAVLVADGTPYSLRLVLWVTYSDGLITRMDQICSAV